MSVQKIFFSYSRSDSAFALKLAKDLREVGADIWIDQLDIPAGSHWDSAVEKALNSAAFVLVILTNASTASTNVMDEVSFALESGKKIIPVLLEDCLAPFRLRRLQRIDFTADYSSGFQQLVNTLELQVKKQDQPTPAVNIPVSTPESASAKEAEKEKREKVMWEDACRINTIESYKRYLMEAVTGEYKAEAKLLIKQLEVDQKEAELEALLWEKAKEENEKNLYQHYLQEYPHGNYKTLALAAIAEIEKAEKEELRRIKELERQQEKERLQKEKEEKDRLAQIEKERLQKEKAEKDRLAQIEKERLQREKQEKEKERQIQKEKELKEKQERDRVAAEQKEKERAEKKERDKQLAIQREQEKLAKQQAKEKELQERIARGEKVPTGINKKYILMAAGVLLLIVVIGAISLKGSKARDRHAWKDALSKNDSLAYAAYREEYPDGLFAEQAKLKVDSFYWIWKYNNDSLQEVRAKMVQDSLNKKKSTSAKQEPVKQEPAKEEPKKPTATTTTPKKKETTTPPKTAPKKLALGQEYQGGVIAYLTVTGDHGMLVSTKEVGSLNWEKAQKVCAAYKVGQYGGWRLPSKDELNIIYQNRQHIGNYSKEVYWSATEDGKNNAWAQNFANGNQTKSNKQSTNAVRAVRPF